MAVALLSTDTEDKGGANFGTAQDSAFSLIDITASTATEQERYVKEQYEKHWRKTLRTCSQSESIYACRDKLAKAKSLPEWQSTLFRDVQHDRGSPLGDKRSCSTEKTAPHLFTCLIEKSSSTTWHKLYDELEGRPEQGSCQRSMGIWSMIWEFMVGPIDERRAYGNANWVSTVTIRDPLRRFLSAYIDKCERYPFGGHCEPKAKFIQNCTWLMMSRKARFRAFVKDFATGKWNVHFWPQALYCDGLWRSIKQFDYTLVLNDTYHSQLAAMGRTLSLNGQPLTEIVNSVLNKKHNHHNDYNHRSRGTVGDYDQVLEYFDKESIATVLSYYAVDYVTLALPVPAWVAQVKDGHADEETRESICFPHGCPGVDLPAPGMDALGQRDWSVWTCQLLSDALGMDNRTGFWGAATSEAVDYFVYAAKCETWPVCAGKESGRLLREIGFRQPPGCFL
jgi:hypothetical protein